MANQAGWVITNPTPLTVIYSGGPSTESLSVATPCGNHPLARSHFGSGILTFTIPFLFRTPPGINLWVRGLTNSHKDGAYPIEGVVETDWSPATFTMNWQVTTHKAPVVFAMDEPICMIIPVQRGLAEALTPVREPLSNNSDLHGQYMKWDASRQKFLTMLSKGDPEALRSKWEKGYFLGQPGLGTPPVDHQTSVRLGPFAPITRSGDS